MDSNFFQKNNLIINNWISTNPNFKGILFEKNIIKFPNGTKINLNDYLLSNILQNEYINNNINNFDINTLLNILDINIRAFKISNTHSIPNDLKIKNVKINNNGKAIAETNKNNIEINGHKALNVLNTYTKLIINDTIHIPVSKLLKSLNDNKYYELINSTNSLKKIDLNYLINYTSFMKKLLINEKYLDNNAKSLLNNYQFIMLNLTTKNNISENEKIALEYYNDLFNKDDNSPQKEKESNILDSSLGFSSITLIGISVVITIMLIFLIVIVR